MHSMSCVQFNNGEKMENLQPLPDAPQPRTLFTIAEFVQLPEFGYLTERRLRHLIFNAQPRYSASGDVVAGNGLCEAGVIKRIGRRILISVPAFRTWVENQNVQAASL